VVYGQASLLDGMIERMSEEMSGSPKVIATGGLAKVIVPYCRNKIILDNELMLHGLRILWEKNR
ncbi:MAG: type III pantothenate kinase, partial [Lachnospiraceae bacterium]